MKQLLLLLLIHFLTIHIEAATITVDDDGGGDYLSIQAAINNAINGDIIDITGGADNIHTEEGIIVDKDLTFKGQGQNTTIIRANATQAAAVDGVFLITTPGVIVIFQDLTITNGNAVNTGASSLLAGGAVYILSNSLTNVSFDRVTMTNNRGEEDGGAVYIFGSNNGIVTFTDCVISNNEANSTNPEAGGGGVVNFGASDFKMIRCSIFGNSAGYSGGGLNLAYGNNLLINCTIFNNSAGGGGKIVNGNTTAVGGGITLSEATSYDLINCTIVNNTLVTETVRVGGGIIHHSDFGLGTLDLINTIVADNSGATFGGNDIFAESAATFTQLTSLVEECTNGTNGICPSFAYSSDPNLAAVNTCGVQSYFEPNSPSDALDNGTAPSSNLPTDDICGATRVANHDLGSYDKNGLVLPIELVVFEGRETPNGNLLTWQTASEINNSYFEIEWSADNYQFAKIGEISGQGTVSERQNYQFLHKNPLVGLNYYRLKQVDHDGKENYHRVITIDRRNNAGLSVFPNPAEMVLTLEFEQILEENGQVSIYDFMGKLVFQTSIKPYAKNIQLDLSVLIQKGLYLIHFQSGSQSESIHFEKI